MSLYLMCRLPLTVSLLCFSIPLPPSPPFPSLQIYRHTDIASAKVDSASCSQVPHHLLSVVDVTEPFNALEYYHKAVAAIEVGILFSFPYPVWWSGNETRLTSACLLFCFSMLFTFFVLIIVYISCDVHNLVNCMSPFQDILSRGRVPLVVGGTGLYVRTLLQGPSGSPSSTPASRERIEEMIKEDGNDWEKRRVG